MNHTKNKKEFIKAWDHHLGALRLLAFTPTKELTEEVSQAIENFKDLIRKVADDKWKEASS